MRELSTVTKAVIHEKKDVLLSIIAGFITGITGVGLFAASGYLISHAALEPPLYALIILTSTVKLLGLVRALSRYAERYYSHRATFSVLSRLRVTFYQKLEPLAPAIFQHYQSGDLLARIVGDVERLQNYFLRVFYPPIVLVMVFLMTILFVMYFSVLIAFVFVLGLLLTTFVIPAWFMTRQKHLQNNVGEKRATLSTNVTEFLHGFRDLKVYQQMDEKEKELLDASKDLIREQEEEGRYLTGNQAINTLLALAISVLVLGIGAYLVSEGHMQGVFLAMLVMIALTVFEEAVPMASFPSYLRESTRAAGRLSHTLQSDAHNTEQRQFELPRDQPVHINVSNVDVHFQDESYPAIKNVNVTIPPGSKTAIVGASGSGKSTLMALLLKLVSAHRGDVSLNGKNVNELKEQSIWENVNVVMQENHFFYGTVQDNLLVMEQAHTDAEIKSVLEKVDLDHLSLDSHIYERGENLSDGEKQRLAMARVLLKKGRTWVLDEPTSSLDAVTEKKIFEYLWHQAKDDTILLITHRITGLENMDQIIVMEGGSVIEKGTYEELMSKQGHFYEIKQFERQVLSVL
ncbi:thiol reductant ABC exporter subunit CydC [Salicibibacter halophilus]|uniref:Thiol reductant ABC exporter subunit CydC n=1 Tax=Salicibibacter halophilus TaxID=2502791 RepID=A0A514LGF8_9BACI|nr:thiol reductant ABC exporter subunit CydC [Salicibibacter halophilus]QDI90933.1 thiol reductant ABC exporter subunit CydC [Salicibibacter halophilus]